MRRVFKALETMAMAVCTAVTILLVGIAPSGPLAARCAGLQEPAKDTAPVAKTAKKLPGAITIQADVSAEQEFKVEITNQPARIGPAVPNANAKSVIQGNIRQLAPILRDELRVLTLAVSPTPAQRREIAMAGGRTVKSVAAKMTGTRPNGAVFRVVQNNGSSDARKQIHAAVEAAALVHLDADRFARYRSEVNEKFRGEREVVVLNIVANIDRLLILSGEQRDKLCESLRTRWNDRVDPSLEAWINYDSFLPTIADAYILPVLTADQGKIWRDEQKINFASMQVNHSSNIPVDADPEKERDPDLKAALAEGTRP